MKKIAKFINGSWPLVIIAPLLMIMEVICDLMQPTLMAEIVDVGIASGDLSKVWATGGRMLAVALLGTLGGAGCTITSAKASLDSAARLRQAMFDKIQTFSFKEIDKLQTSSLITRLTNDVTILQQTLRTILCMMVRAPFSCIGGLVMAIIISPKLSLIFVVAIPIMALSATFILPRVFPMFAKMQEKIDRVNTVMRENLLGVRVVKAFVGQEREKRRFDFANRDLMEWAMSAMKKMMLMMPLITAVMNLSVVALLWYGGVLVMAGDLEVGKIMAFMTYLMQVLSSLMMAGMMMMQFSRAKVAMDRCSEVLDTESSIVDPDQANTPSDFTVEFDHVNFSYNDTDPEPVLKDITFTAKPGQRVGIIGNTGSGKSTLVSLIPRLYDVTDGAVRIGGVDVRDMDQHELRKHVGVVLQEPFLFSRTIAENIAIAKSGAEQDAIAQAAKDACLDKSIGEFKDGYETIVGERGVTLSGGQKQRTAIARTLLTAAPIMVFDDALSAVDAKTDEAIRTRLREAAGDATLILIAHRVSTLMQADEIIVLENGKIIERGDHDALMKKNGVYARVAKMQSAQGAGEEEGA